MVRVTSNELISARFFDSLIYNSLPALITRRDILLHITQTPPHIIYVRLCALVRVKLLQVQSIPTPDQLCGRLGLQHTE